MKPVLCSIFIYFALFLPSFSTAQESEKEAFNKSIELYQNGKFKESSQILAKLIRQNPQKALYWFNLGNCSYMVENYESAEKYYQKVSSLPGALRPAGQLYQAKALKMLERNEQASLLLQQLIASNPPPGVLKEAKDDLILLQSSESTYPKDTSDFYQERKRRPYWAFFDSSYGTIDNPYLEGRSTTPTSSSLIKASLGTGYHFHRGQAWSEKIAYILNYENPQNATDLQTMQHTLETSLNLEKRNYGISLTPYFQQQVWDNTPASQKLGMTLKGSYNNEAYEMGTDIDGSSQNATNANYEYLSGTSYSLRPYFGIWGNSFYSQIYFIGGLDGSQDINYSDGSRLPLQHSYQGLGLRNMWRFSAKTSLYLSIAQLQKTYKNPSLPENKQRKDDETSISLRVAHMIFQKFFLYGVAEYIANKSSLVLGDVRDKNYNVSSISVGFSWDAFE